MVGRSLRTGDGIRWVVAVLATAAIAGLAGCAAPPVAAPTGHPRPATTSIGATVFPVAQRTRVPAVRGTTLDGRTLDLRAVAGHGLLVVNVWASWCENCRAESAALAALARTLAPSGTSFVGIDEQDTAGRARSFVAAAGTTYPQLADSDGHILSQLSALPSFGIPSTLVVDTRSMIAARFIGAVTRDQLQALITRVSMPSSRDRAP